MIDKKKIEEAADKLAENYYQQPLKDTAIHEGFMAGVNWFKEELWHDVSEEPEEDKEILYEYYRNSTIFKCPTYSTQFIMGVDYQEVVLNPEYGKTTRWLYIDDLMKGEK